MIQVKIENAMSAAERIRNQNNKINDIFQKSTRVVENMDANWNGSASQNAMQAFYKVARYVSPRYQTIENYAAALEKVAMGYSKTEQSNMSLSNLFK